MTLFRSHTQAFELDENEKVCLDCQVEQTGQTESAVLKDQRTDWG